MVDNVKFLIGEKDGAELSIPEEFAAYAKHILFDPTGTEFTKLNVAEALVEAKNVILVDADPTILGLAADVGKIAVKNIDPVDIWIKYGIDDTSWRVIGFGAGGGSGVTPPFFFTKGGNATSGSYLSVGDVPSSSCGHTVPGTNKIVKMTVSVRVLSTGGQTIQLTRRTGLTAVSDIPGAFITMVDGSYTTTTIIDVNLNTNEEIGARVSVGSFKDPVLNVFVVPR